MIGGSLICWMKKLTYCKKDCMACFSLFLERYCQQCSPFHTWQLYKATRYNIDSIGKPVVAIVIDNSNILSPISSIYSHLHLYNIVHNDFTLSAEWGQSKQKMSCTVAVLPEHMTNFCGNLNNHLYNLLASLLNTQYNALNM